jgi:Family of unknown function (DUF6069)
MTTTTAQPTRTSLSRNAITVTGAAVGALALWLVETRLIGVDLAVRTGDVVQPVTGVSVVATALVAGLAATLSAWLLTRLAPRRCRTVWTVLASAVLLVSLLGPLGATSPAAVVSLVALHLLVGLALLLGLRGSFTTARGYGE